jgi:predicted nuclease of predicted toxin-antitoxin system
MRILLDMNLPPRWVEFLGERGIEATHWSAVGDPRAGDGVIMAWARHHGCVVFTHDLDFSAILAATHAQGPSILQVRTQDVMPEHIGEHVVEVIRSHIDVLEGGAIISVHVAEARVRILPIRGA